MEELKKFSALRLNKQNIYVFQDVKFVVESVRFRKMSNDDLLAELISCFLKTNSEYEQAYHRMLASRDDLPAPDKGPAIDANAAEADTIG